MRLGDFIVIVSMVLNVSAAGLYAYQGHWNNVGYWLSAFALNGFLLRMK